MLLLASPRGQTAAALTNATAFVVFVALGTIAHELGHTLAAVGMGMNVTRFAVGRGPALATIRVLGVEWRLGTIFSGGETSALCGDPRWWRARRLLFLAGGPAATAALVALASWAATGSAVSTFAPGDMLLYSQGLILAVNLFPWTSRRSTGSDGLQMFLLAWVPRPSAEELEVGVAIANAIEARQRGDRSAARQACARALARAPEDIGALTVRGVLDCEDGRFTEARERFSKLLDRSDVAPMMRAVLENDLAWAAVMSGDEALLPMADDLSKRALARWRGAPMLGTRGAVLVRLGRPREARRHLQRAFESHDRDANLAHVAGWMAAAASAESDRNGARDWFATAKALDRRCTSLPVVRALLRRKTRRTAPTVA